MKFLTLCAGLLLVLSQAYLAVADDQAALVPVVNYLLFHKAAINCLILFSTRQPAVATQRQCPWTGKMTSTSG